MAKKNKARNAQKKRQKRSLKSARRKAAQKKTSPKKKELVTEQMFPDEDLIFWLAHGVNYILSDYDTGTWKPLFEEIYEGKKLDPEVIARTLVNKFGDSSEGWTPQAEAALHWSVQPRESVYFYFLEVLRRLRKKDHSRDECSRLAVAPHNGVVWGVFRMVQQELAKRKEKRKGTETPEEDPA